MKKYRLYKVTSEKACPRCKRLAVPYYVLAVNQEEVEKCKREGTFLCFECIKNKAFEFLREGAYLTVEE
jgi:hypothetical protein